MRQMRQLPRSPCDLISRIIQTHNFIERVVNEEINGIDVAIRTRHDVQITDHTYVNPRGNPSYYSNHQSSRLLRPGLDLSVASRRHFRCLTTRASLDRASLGRVTSSDPFARSDPAFRRLGSFVLSFVSSLSARFSAGLNDRFAGSSIALRYRSRGGCSRGIDNTGAPAIAFHRAFHYLKRLHIAQLQE